ncbi:MAG TPA: RNA polymerase sigma factor [Vicinamibacterales bacterium]|nr:RNA polymerase sigma factor [Vicinamibacterales bacterium]
MGRPAKSLQGGSPESDRGPEAEAELCRLMIVYLDGRLDAFDAVYAALAGRVRGYVYSLCRDASLADDLVQDTFMQLHRSRRTYEPGRPVTPWVFAIARHVFLMHRRSAGRRLRFEETLIAQTPRADRPHDDVAALIDRDEVRRTLRQVPADQRQAVLMHHVEGRSFAEIAARLGIHVNAAKTRAFRGMKTLRALMKGSRD